MTQSKRTGGPKTLAGKMASSQNALKTGAYSAVIVLPGESEDDFRELEAQFVRDFSPGDVVAATLLHTLTVLTWKKLRAQKIEHAGLMHTLSARFDILDFFKISLPFEGDDVGRALTVVDGLSQAEEEEWTTAFNCCKQFIETRPSPQELEALQQLSPMLFNYLEIGAIDAGIEDCRLWSTTKVTLSDAKSHQFVSYYCLEFLKEFALMDSVIEHIELLRQRVKEIKETRLLAFIKKNGMQRVHDDLDRAFYRTLAELRKHQQWRQDRNIIDVTPKLPV